MEDLMDLVTKGVHKTNPLPSFTFLRMMTKLWDQHVIAPTFRPLLSKILFILRTYHNATLLKANQYMK